MNTYYYNLNVFSKSKQVNFLVKMKNLPGNFVYTRDITKQPFLVGTPPKLLISCVSTRHLKFQVQCCQRVGGLLKDHGVTHLF